MVVFRYIDFLSVSKTLLALLTWVIIQHPVIYPPQTSLLPCSFFDRDLAATYKSRRKLRARSVTEVLAFAQPAEGMQLHLVARIYMNTSVEAAVNLPASVWRWDR